MIQTIATTPRLMITDRRGRRVVRIDKPLVTLGRRTESDVCVTSVGVSRHHADIAAGSGTFRLRDRDSKCGTFVNGARAHEHVLAHGDRIRLGESGETDIVFLTNEDDGASERSVLSAANELRDIASLLRGLRALGPDRVVDEVLPLVLDSAIDVTGAERGFIMLAGADGNLEFTLGRGAGRVTLPDPAFDTSRKIPEAVFATGQLRIVTDLMDGGLASQHLGTVALGIRHVLCAPLRPVRYVEKGQEHAEDKTIGVLYLDSREAAALRSEAARRSIETLSTEAAGAIENARLYQEAVAHAALDHELTVAAAIQHSFLPASNRRGTFFSTAGTSVPCRSLGGDFFDYADIADGQFAFIVGDVAGKGPPAALLAAATLGIFIAESGYHSRCAPLVTRVNHGLFRRRIPGRFVTAFYGILSADGSLAFSNAGHSPPVLVTSSGVRRLETGGLVLGLFEDAAFNEESLALAPGDVIVAASDGVSKALNEVGEEYTDERLLASVCRSHGRPAQEILDGLLADLRQFCDGAIQNDDVTMVVVRYEG